MSFLRICSLAVAVTVVGTISVLSLIPQAWAAGYISITGDDSTASMNKLAQILNEEGIRGTFYLTTDFLDTPGHITSVQAIAIRHMGHMIGDHTLDHPNITTLSTIELRDQICTSKQVLEELTWFPVVTFAYPFGDGGKVAAIVQELKRAGYIAARGTDRGFNTRATNPYNLLSFSFHKSIPITLMQSKAAEAAANNWWIIYTVHHINVSTEDWNVSSSDLSSQTKLFSYFT